MKLVGVLILIFVLSLLAWSLYGMFAMADVEGPSYRVLEQKAGYEIRAYESFPVAEVASTGSYELALDRGFTALVEYIRGGNLYAERIAMRRPVFEKSAGSSGRIISFTLPKEYLEEPLPPPTNASVITRTMPSRTVAVLSFSWSDDAATIEAKKLQFLALLKEEGQTIIGVPEAAYYSPPFVPPFMQKTEVMVPVRLPR